MMYMHGLLCECSYFYGCDDTFILHTQLNETNTTYLDVCPLLGPSPSTPSGDYVQPVNIARDIELQTRNLPAPVSFNSGLYIFAIFDNIVSHVDQWIQVCLQFGRNCYSSSCLQQ